MKKHSRILVTLVATLIVSVVVMGCSSSNRYCPLNDWAKRLDLGVNQHVQIRDYHGSDSEPGDPPTLLMVVDGTPGQVDERVVAALDHNDFSKSPNANTWALYGNGKRGVILHVLSFDKGQAYYFQQAGKRIVSTRASTIYWLIVSTA